MLQADEQRLPMRLLSRRMTALAIEGARVLAEPFDQDLTQALIFTAILCSNVSPHAYASPEAERLATGDDQPDEGLRRPISVGSLSKSLNLPLETVRRRCATLETQGFLLRTRTGLIVPQSVVRGPAVQAPWLRCLDLTFDTFALLRRRGVEVEAWVPASAPGSGFSRLVQARIVLDAVQRLGEHWRVPWGGQLGAFLIHGVLDANVGWLDFPPNAPMAYAYADTPPPDALRRGVTVPALARRLGLPVATTRRWASRLLAEGWLQDVGGALIVDAATLDRPGFTNNVAALMMHSLRMLTALKQSGFFDVRPAS